MVLHVGDLEEHRGHGRLGQLLLHHARATPDGHGQVAAQHAQRDGRVLAQAGEGVALAAEGEHEAPVARPHGGGDGNGVEPGDHEHRRSATLPVG